MCSRYEAAKRSAASSACPARFSAAGGSPFPFPFGLGKGKGKGKGSGKGKGVGTEYANPFERVSKESRILSLRVSP